MRSLIQPHGPPGDPRKELRNDPTKDPTGDLRVDPKRAYTNLVQISKPNRPSISKYGCQVDTTLVNNKVSNRSSIRDVFAESNQI